MNGTLAVVSVFMLSLIAVTSVLLAALSNGQRTSASTAAPQREEVPEVQFVLFTRQNDPYVLNRSDYNSIASSKYDIRVPTKIVIHGFLSSIQDEIFTLIKEAYLKKGEYNVIGVDWSALCHFEYFSAMRGAQLAGKSLGSFLDFVYEFGVKGDDVHLIGHSLGAHVAGIGSGMARKLKVGRITGLDPAGPGYADIPVNLRLDPGDASLVDVIHTYNRILSLAQQLGHLDFYPNGGQFQPGCPDIYNIWKVAESINCNHGRAYMYFAEAVGNEKAFNCKRCRNINEALKGECFENSTVYMANADTYEMGLYYVKTNPQPPFSLT